MADWTPAEITTGLLLWLDAADGDTITVDTGVSQWSDKSGAANHASQATSTNQPAHGTNQINGIDVVTFDGSDDVLVGAASLFSGSDPCAMFVVYKPITLTGIDSFFGQSGTTGTGKWRQLQHRTLGVVGDPNFVGYGADLTDSTSPTAAAKMAGFLYNGSSGYLYRDGSLIASGSLSLNTNDVAYRVGSSIGGISEFANTDIAEIIVCATALSSIDRERIEGYLAWKWGIEGSLPVSHPYYSSAPQISPIILSTLVQSWRLYVGDSFSMSSLEQLWNITEPIADPATIEQLWGLKLGADLQQRWADAPVLKKPLDQPWGNAGLIRAQLVQRWRDMVTLRARLDQPWAIMDSLLVALEQPWAITSGPVQALLDQGWDIKDITPVLAVLNQPWSLASDGTVLSYTVEVFADGHPVRVSHVNIEGGLDADVLACEIHPETEAEYLLCPFGAELTVSITSQEGTDEFVFVVTAPRIDEQHGATSYVVEAMSPAALLGAPYAEPMDGDLSGLASAIAAELAGDLDISWETVDWFIPVSTWIASGETPLALLKTLAAAVGAVVQADPDGTIAIRPRYPVAVPQWTTATPDITLTETLDCFSTGSTPDHRYGYNRFLISNQSASADSLTLEQEDISATVKEVRGYQVPWNGLFDLTHTGGGWVVIEPLGIETREETETVEFVSGAGATRYPMYGLVSVEWQQNNLGTITTAEDGSLTSSVDGQSLAEITYTTKCKLWRVTDPRGEQLQLVAEI